MTNLITDRIRQQTFNIPAVLVVMAVTALLVLGVKISSRLNAVVVTIKLAVILFVIVAGLFFVKGAHYAPFIPPARPTPSNATPAHTASRRTPLGPP